MNEKHFYTLGANKAPQPAGRAALLELHRWFRGHIKRPQSSKSKEPFETVGTRRFSTRKVMQTRHRLG